MDRHMQTGVRVKIRTITIIIISALLVSIILIMAFPHKSGALLPEVVQGTTSLLQQTTAPVIGPVTQPQSPAQTVVPAPSVVRSSPARVATPPYVATSPTAPSRSASAISTATPKSLMSSHLQTINFSKVTEDSSRVVGQSASFAVKAGDSQSFMWMQASAEGWKFMGVLWYWWMLLSAYIAIGIVARKGNAGWYLMRLWLSLQHKRYAN